MSWVGVTGKKTRRALEKASGRGHERQPTFLPTVKAGKKSISIFVSSLSQTSVSHLATLCCRRQLHFKPCLPANCHHNVQWRASSRHSALNAVIPL
eukprot:1151572-Pelagomonas_calceolata.AAC.9